MTTDDEAPNASSFLASASLAQLIGQCVLTGGPVVLALAGGSPRQVTTLFVTLALFRAPYILALGMVAQLTTRVTALVVDGRIAVLEHDAAKARVATAVVVVLAVAGGAWWDPGAAAGLRQGRRGRVAADRRGGRRLHRGRGEPAGRWSVHWRSRARARWRVPGGSR